MANTPNTIDYAGEDLATFLAKSTSDGTNEDIYGALKTDAPGSAVPATGISTAAGALLGNGRDDAFQASYPNNRNVALGNGGLTLTTGPAKTANYTAVAGELVRYIATGGTFTVDLPTSPANNTRVGIVEVDNDATQITVDGDTSLVVGPTGVVGTSILVGVALGVMIWEFNSLDAAWVLVSETRAPAPATGWRLGDSTTVNMTSNGALYLFDDGLTDGHNSNTLVKQAGTETYIELMGKTFLVLDGATYYKAVHNSTLDALGDLSISFVATYRGAPPTSTHTIVSYGDAALSGGDANQNLNYLTHIFSGLWAEIHENGTGTNNTVTMGDPSAAEVGMIVGMWHYVRKSGAKTGEWYFNRNLTSGPSAYANNATTGGTPAQELWVGANAVGGTFSKMWIADLKINPGTALTQAQIDAEYEQVFG